jgi:cell division protein FtsB
MRQFHKKKQIRKYLYSKFSIFLMFILIFFLSRGTIGIYQKHQESLSRKNLSAARLARLEQREAEIKDEIYRLESRLGIEEELRSRYSFAKEGEKLIIILNNNESEEFFETVEDKNIWEKTMSWFQGFNLLK